MHVACLKLPETQHTADHGWQLDGSSKAAAWLWSDLTFSVAPVIATTCVVSPAHCSLHVAPYCSASSHSGCCRGLVSSGMTRLNTRRTPSNTWGTSCDVQGFTAWVLRV